MTRAHPDIVQQFRCPKTRRVKHRSVRLFVRSKALKRRSVHSGDNLFRKVA